jgi:hypothetical protein
MKKALVILLVLAACNNEKKDTPAEPGVSVPANATDTRTINPNDTAKHVDTGAYDQMSDSLRKQ